MSRSPTFLHYRLPSISLVLSLMCCFPLSTNADDNSSAAQYNYDLNPFLAWLDNNSVERQIPGAALAVVSREGIMHMETWGVKDISENDLVTVDSIFRIASMSKTFAGTAANLLVNQNLQSWDAKVVDLFPSMHLGTGTSSEGITFRHIVSHSSGLMPHSYSNMLDDGVGYPKIKEKFNQIPTVCMPGQCYGYQNVVFSLIGDVVELSTGESYERYLEEQIFKPLGMISASVGMEPYESSVDVTSPHIKSRRGWRGTTTNAAYYSVAPASGVNASIFDMSMWLRANLGAFPEILDEEFLHNLHEPIIATPNGYFNRWSGLEKAYYATGWRVLDYKGMRVVHHGGGVRGYRSEMAFVLDANIGMVLLFNAESNLANDVIPAFLDNLTSSLSQ